MGNSIQSTLPETLPLFQEAHARHSDPATSHAAAKSVVNIGPLQQRILAVFRRCGQLTDECLIAELRRNPLAPSVTDSGVRSRRAELVRLNLLRDSGRTAQISTGRQATVWSAV